MSTRVLGPGPPGAASHPERAPSLRLGGVSVVRDGRPLLENVHWEVAPGSRWVLLGPNGSGKTTLLQVAGARMLPSAGTADVLGERLGRVDMRLLRARIAMVSAAVARQLRPTLTARDVVVTGRDGALDPQWRRVPAADWVAADRMLARLGLAGEETGAGEQAWADRPFGVLSEGERQRVLIARALVGSAELVLLDEPAAGLDLGARERLLARLAALAADATVPALVLVTHHLEEIPSGFTHAALLRAGRIVGSGPIEAVLDGAQVSDCFGVRVHVERRGDRWRAVARG